MFKSEFLAHCGSLQLTAAWAMLLLGSLWRGHSAKTRPAKQKLLLAASLASLPRAEGLRVGRGTLFVKPVDFLALSFVAALPHCPSSPCGSAQRQREPGVQ